MNSRNQAVNRLAARNSPRPADMADLPGRLSDLVSDLEAAVGVGDLGGIAEATRGLRRLAMDVEDGWVAISC